MLFIKIGLYSWLFTSLTILDCPRFFLYTICKCKMNWNACKIKISVLTILSPVMNMLIWKESIINSTVLAISLVFITLKSLMNSVCLTSVCRSQWAKQWAFVLVLTLVISSRTLKLEVRKIWTYLNFMPVVEDLHNNSERSGSFSCVK